VKELGPGGPVDSKSAESPERDDYPAAGAMSPQNSDLYRLRSSNVSKPQWNMLMDGGLVLVLFHSCVKSM
jgi:hypothetical protein